MSSLTLRLGRPADTDTVAAFNTALALESEGKQLPLERLRAGVAALLADPSKGFYLVAEQAGRIVGQLMIVREWSDWRNAYWWWINSVYVAPDSRRAGVFRALYAETLARARREGAHGLRLYVARENQGAKSTYTALGMKRAHYELYELGEE